MLKNQDRVDKVARFVADHYRNNVEPMGYKAFMVAVDREACVLYKQALDKYLPPEGSEVVISTGGKNDQEHLRRHGWPRTKRNASARRSATRTRNRRS